jgi:hypothetical protein
MNQPYGNKRKHRRFTVDVMDIQGGVLFDIGVVINDVSISGVSLLVDRKLDIGQVYTLRIKKIGMEVPMQGTIVWMSENESDISQGEVVSLKYSAGFQFAPLKQESVSHLVKFIETNLIERHAKLNVHEMSGSRHNVRFNVEMKEKATLNFAGEYMVRELSLGGMLIKSSHALELESRLRMKITISPEIHLAFVGRVASCIQTGNRPGASFDIGIGFVDMSGEARIKLKEFIRRLYIEDAGFAEV